MSDESSLRQGPFGGCLVLVIVALLLILPVWAILTMSFAQLAMQLDGWKDLPDGARTARAAWAALPLTLGGFAIVVVLVRAFGTTGTLLDRVWERRARDRYGALSEGGDELPGWGDDE